MASTRWQPTARSRMCVDTDAPHVVSLPQAAGGDAARAGYERLTSLLRRLDGSRAKNPLGLSALEAAWLASFLR
jgi:hypothetical protein